MPMSEDIELLRAMNKSRTAAYPWECSTHEFLLECLKDTPAGVLQGISTSPLLRLLDRTKDYESGLHRLSRFYAGADWYSAMYKRSTRERDRLRAMAHALASNPPCPGEFNHIVGACWKDKGIILDAPTEQALIDTWWDCMIRSLLIYAERLDESATYARGELYTLGCNTDGAPLVMQRPVESQVQTPAPATAAALPALAPSSEMVPYRAPPSFPTPAPLMWWRRFLIRAASIFRKARP